MQPGTRMTAEQRDEWMLRILKNIQKRLGALEAKVEKGFKDVRQRIDQHRAFAIDHLRDHELRLRRIENR